ncbi:MAG: carbohydrate binding domain-containing protein, partial [Candidatus Hydrothermae bacterium]|nr:carbohydrate binding domain-containing protein [Candidatus Hydrothermae bacterium]
MKRIEFATSYTNLFSNPSFESGATGWNIQGGSVVQTYLAKDGSYAVFYDEGGHFPAYILTSNPITLSAGTYEMSVWIYVSDTPSGTIEFGLQPDGGSWTIFAQFSFHSSGWKLFTAYLTIDTPGDYYLKVGFSGLIIPSNCLMYVDALELVDTANVYEIPVNPIDGLLPSLKGDNIVLTTTLDGSIVLQKYESGYDPRIYNLIWRGYLP